MSRTIGSTFRWYRPDTIFEVGEVWLEPPRPRFPGDKTGEITRAAAFVPVDAIRTMAFGCGHFRIPEADEFPFSIFFGNAPSILFKSHLKTSKPVRLTIALIEALLAVENEADAAAWLNKYGLLMKPTLRLESKHELNEDFQPLKCRETLLISDFFVNARALKAMRLSGLAMSARRKGNLRFAEKLRGELCSYLRHGEAYDVNKFYFEYLKGFPEPSYEYPDPQLPDDDKLIEFFYSLSKRELERELRTECELLPFRASSNGKLAFSILPKTLYTWIALQIYEEHFIEASKNELIIECLLCGAPVPEPPKARGKKMFCNDAHRKEFKKYGAGGNPARQQNQANKASFESDVKVLIDKYLKVHTKAHALKQLKKALVLRGEDPKAASSDSAGKRKASRTSDEKI